MNVLEVPAGDIAYKTWGPENGRKVLALHGWLDNAASFDLIAPLLPGLRIVAVDLLGHGLSSHRPNGSMYHFSDTIPLTIDIMDALDWDRCSLLGHSMGGAISTLVAGAFPERFEKVALIEALGPFSGLAQDASKRARKSVEQFHALEEKRMPVYATVDEAVKARHAAGDMKESSVRTLVSRGLVEVEGGFTWRTDPRLRVESTTRMTEEQVVSFLAAITCPVMVVRAKNGLPLENAFIESRTRAIKNLKLVEVDGGHHVHMDDPELVAKHVSQFLR